ncbi:MAG: phage head-tail connector protein [Magnetococcales bacterium]|nr:phage head-tail connector protein [Magnetococcales bacterium]
MPLKLVCSSTVEPVSLEEAKLHLRVDGNAEDTAIMMMLSSARQSAELLTGRQLMPATGLFVLDCFPSQASQGDNSIVLPVAPVQSITRIQYADPDGMVQTISSSDYLLLVGEPARIVPRIGLAWPAAATPIGMIQIEFEAGYASEWDIPAPLKTWILMRTASMYAQREGDSRFDIKKVSFLDDLLNPFQVSRT